MKPLTIEQIRNLEIGDWVWIVVLQSDNFNKEHKGRYYHIHYCGDHGDKELWCGWQGYTTTFEYVDYGTKWVAYKNKEQAEAKGEIVELPCIESFTTCNSVTGAPFICYNILYRDKASGELAIDCKVDELEAYRRLEELKGEKK